MVRSCRLGSPASTEGGTFSWTVPFMLGARERGLRVDFVALHWHDDCAAPQTLASFLAKVRGQSAFAGLPLWQAEFSYVKGDAALNTRFLRAALRCWSTPTQTPAWSGTRGSPTGGRRRAASTY